ncbi:MAG TPA: ribosome assembly cofactor RimP [Bacteroidales bacterium]|jgi:ribosome maturation factor RimP|nr:ribosome assembly cofactor RimP [Bacteroidales bacterium]
MVTKENIRDIIAEIVEEKEAFIVDIKVSSSNKINIEIDSFRGFTIDDCVEVSRLVESGLDRDKEDFELEVASAGLSEPFKVVQQYQKNIGKEVETLTNEGLKIKGILANVSDTGFELEESKKVKAEGKKKKQDVIEKHKFSFDQVKSTKIVITFK